MSDGMSKEWTSPVNMHLNCTSVLARKRQRMTIHTFIAIITRLLWPKKDSSLAHRNRAAIWLRGELFFCRGISDGFDGILINQIWLETFTNLGQKF